MSKIKVLATVVLSILVGLGSSSVVAMAQGNNEMLLSLLSVKNSRLVLENYNRLAVAKVETDIIDNNGARVGILEADSAADVLDIDGENIRLLVVSNGITGYVPMDNLLIGKDAEYKAVELLSQSEKDNEIDYEYTTFVADVNSGDKSFEVKVNGELSKAVSINEIEQNKSATSIADRSIDEKEADDAEDKDNVYKRNIKCSEADFELLAAIVYCEVGNQPFATQKAVANVVLNRVEDKRFPSTIKKVIYARGQFGPVRNGSLSRALKKGVSKAAHDAARAALNGDNNVEGYLYFDGKAHKSNYKKMGPVYFWKTPW